MNNRVSVTENEIVMREREEKDEQIWTVVCCRVGDRNGRKEGKGYEK